MKRSVGIAAHLAATSLLVLAGCEPRSVDGPASEGAGAGLGLSTGSDVVSTIVARHSGRCVDVPAFTNRRGAQLLQWSCNGGANQRFHLTQSADGTLVIRPDHAPGLCLDHGPARDGTPVVQADCNGSARQRFRLREGANGAYAITTADGAGCLDVTGVSRDVGATIQTWSCHGGDNQSFAIAALTADSSPPRPPIDPAPPPTEPEPVGDGDVNLLVRGQSNALLFVQWGGVWVMRSRVASALGIAEERIHVIADWDHPDGANTINSGTSFLDDWMKPDLTSGRLEDGLLARIRAMSSVERARPTVIFWMHNEYDGQIDGLTEERWTSAVRADAALVRDALGQPATRTPYAFTFLPYGYASGDSPAQIKRGQANLAADPSFHATVLPDVPQAAMGDPSHMSDEGSDLAGEAVAPRMVDVVRPLLGGPH